MSLLQDLYEGKVNPRKNIVMDKESINLLDGKVVEEIRYWKSVLTREQYQRFRVLQKLYAQIREEEAFENFRCGMAMGLLLMRDAVDAGKFLTDDYNDLLYRQDW